MQTSARLRADTWVRGCVAAGLLLLGVSAVVEVPWLLWLAWAYVGVLSVWDVVSDT